MPAVGLILQNAIANDPAFQRRMQSALVNESLAEAGSQTPAIATLAKAVLNGGGPPLIQFSQAVAGNGAVQSDLNADLTAKDEATLSNDMAAALHLDFPNFA